MTSTRLWDRAAALPVAVDGRRLPEVAALPAGLPTVAELFDFMRERNYASDADPGRVAPRAATAKSVGVSATRPGKGHDEPARRRLGGHTRSGMDGDLVRTYAAAHKLGTQRPIRNRPRGLADPDFPGTARVYEPVTALPMETLPDTFVHPAGYCQNVLATGRCAVIGTELLIA
jgi:hypothetical protein